MEIESTNFCWFVNYFGKSLVKYIFIIFFSFCGLFFNNGLRAAEKINIKFEEMKIPLTIEQLSKLEKYKDDSTELIDWLKKMDL